MVVFCDVSTGAEVMFFLLVGCVVLPEKIGVALVEINMMMVPKISPFFRRFPLIFFPR